MKAHYIHDILVPGEVKRQLRSQMQLSSDLKSAVSHNPTLTKGLKKRGLTVLSKGTILRLLVITVRLTICHNCLVNVSYRLPISRKGSQRPALSCIHWAGEGHKRNTFVSAVPLPRLECLRLTTLISFLTWQLIYWQRGQVISRILNLVLLSWKQYSTYLLPLSKTNYTVTCCN